MSSEPDEGPVYYREIQKNAYLKRIPNETSGSKLRPLGHKKPPLKPMWTLFCVHNGRSPYLEQYPLAEGPATRAHRPVWRASLRTARHVTASVTPRAGSEYDFLVDTDHGPVRMVAPDWDSMHEWVSTLRSKLHELRILSRGENVYCAAPPPPRRAARDPTSPLPPTPPVPPDRVPGIELTTPVRRPLPPEPADGQRGQDAVPPAPPGPAVDISGWDEAEPTPLPGTSAQAQDKTEPKKSVAKICGQNICLDDSILKRSADPGDSDEEFFERLDQTRPDPEGYRQTLVVADEERGEETSDRQASNITVIQVSNRPPHTAIPVLGAETVFDFPTAGHAEQSFVNIVNTEVNVNSENGYGTVFNGSDYGHLSLTTTVSTTAAVNVTDVSATAAVNVTDVSATADKHGVYERLCMASTSNEAVSKIKRMERVRKSSLPNMDVPNTDTTYEYLYPNNSTVTVNGQGDSCQSDRCQSDSCQGDGRQSDSCQGDSRQSDRCQGNSRQSDSCQSDVSRNGEADAAVAVASLSLNTTPFGSNVDRSHSQNGYDEARVRGNVCRRVQNGSPKREGRNDKQDGQPKPIWRRGLTELSLLTRLRSLAPPRRHSPVRDSEDRSGTSPVKVVHRSRPETRADGTRRRSSSLSNGQSPPLTSNACGLVPLRRRQALALQAEQRRRAALPATVPAHSPPVLAEYGDRLWIAWWGVGGARFGGRLGDRLVGVRAAQPRDLHHARQLMRACNAPLIDLLFHRVPLAKIYVLNKRDQESIGIKLDGECTVTSVEAGSPAARAGLPPPGKWAVTEINNRPLNIVKGGEEEMNRLSLHGTEVSVLIQPAPLVKKLRAAIKANKTLLSAR